MRCRASVRLTFGSPAEAERLAASLAPENDGFLTARVEGRVLALDAEADGPLSLMRTLDDALACLSAAERAAKTAERST
ncbi:MAG TPA: KEOPS complex subunit Pcc1 [Candidatus Thermoplasmatota archaeon]|nr:KEOPS complex subunit Pcc1 [Candidatus Thermoplasmatota archaeon]